VAAFLAAPADAPVAEQVHEHIAACPSCRAWVSELARASWVDARPQASSELDCEPPEEGRYVPLVKLGAGSMGTVWAAYDAMLDREVALKVLDTTHATGTSAATRLRAEAQALAALSHPNVVEVLDVQLDGPRPALAMPVVEGPTLDLWLALAPRTCSEILEVFEQAGRGLEAAHAAGLVHCDFKPSNAIVGADGHVRVLDFGLAQRTGTSPGARWAGTPAYMSPEQHRGKPATSRSDQFSWCVALHEALFGVRPDSPRPPDPRGATDAVPHRVRRVLERGLKVGPAERWPSMGALLCALARPRGHRRWIAVAGVVSVLALTGLAADSANPCRTDDAAQSTWGAMNRTIVHAAVRDGAPPLEAAHAARVEYIFAQRSAQLSSEVDQLCRTGQQLDTNARDQRRRCLDRSAHHLRLAVDALAQGLAPLDAVTLAERVPAVASCLEPTRDREPMDAHQVDLDHSLVELRVRSDAGDHAGALARAEALQGPIERTGHAGLRSRHAFAYATAQTYAGQDGTAQFETAARVGANGGDRSVAALAALQLAGGYSPGVAIDFDRSNRWLERAEALIESDGLNELRPDLARASGNAALSAGRYDEAIASLRTSVTLAKKADSAVLVVARNLEDLATAQREAGRLDAAEETQTLALRRYEDLLGSRHPFSAAALENLAHVWRDSGRFEKAADAYARSLEIQEATVGPEHLSVTVVATNLASTHLLLGNASEAVVLLERVIAIEAQQLSPGRATAATLHALGNAHVLQDDLAAAHDAFSIGLEQMASELGRGHPLSAMFLSSLASVALDRGNAREAIAFATESQALRRVALGAADPRLAFEDLVLAGAFLEQGQPELALSRAEHGEALLRDDPVRPLWLAELVYFRARALADLSRRDLAVEAASESAARFEAEGDKANAAEVRDWARAQHKPA